MTANVSPQLPFRPCGNTVRIAAVTPTPPTAVQLALFAGEVQVLQVRIRISSAATGDVTIGWGGTAAEALANAVLPTAATAGTKSILMSAGTIEVMTFPPGTYFTALSSAGTINVDMTPGDGP